MACSNSAEGRSQFQGEGEEPDLTESMWPTLKSSWIPHFLYGPHPGRPQGQKSEFLNTPPYQIYPFNFNFISTASVLVQSSPALTFTTTFDSYKQANKKHLTGMRTSLPAAIYDGRAHVPFISMSSAVLGRAGTQMFVESKMRLLQQDTTSWKRGPHLRIL